MRQETSLGFGSLARQLNKKPDAPRCAEPPPLRSESVVSAPCQWFQRPCRPQPFSKFAEDPFFVNDLAKLSAPNPTGVLYQRASSGLVALGVVTLTER